MSEFKDNPKLLREYDGIIREQRNNGIVSDANVFNESRIGRVYYMPHRPVVRADKSTTKVRMVFDASSSAKKSQALSLNDYLFSGPSLTSPLIDVIIRFRAFFYVIVADIEKAFLQIELAPEHRNFVRFLFIIASNISKYFQSYI